MLYTFDYILDVLYVLFCIIIFILLICGAGLYGGGGIKDTIFAKTPGNNALFHSLMSADMDHLLQRHFTLLMNTKLSPTTASQFLCQVLEKNS